MDWVYDDGGRGKYFKAEHVGDCVTRAIAIATGKDYKEVYDDINMLAKSERKGKRKKGTSSARNGVYASTAKKLLEKYGWKWVPTMQIGSGCKVHVRSDELPIEAGNLILSLSRHFTAVVDGVIHDTYDCSREGTRCVYGYWIKPVNAISALEFEKRIKWLMQDFADGYMSAAEFGKECEKQAEKRTQGMKAGA